MFVGEKRLRRIFTYFCIYTSALIAVFVAFILAYIGNTDSFHQISIYLAIFLLVLFFIIGGANFMFMYVQTFQSNVSAPIIKYTEIVTCLGIGDAVTISPGEYPAEYAREFLSLTLLQERIIRNTDDLKILNSYISHEMKNSVSVLSAMVQLSSPKEEVLQYIRHMTESVENILALSQVKTEDEFQRADLSMVCAMAVDDYRKKCRGISLSIPETGVSEVIGRENLFYRAISNLLDNAIKYGDSSGVRVDVSEKKGSVIVRVHNFGKPIDTSHLQNIFETNYRIKSLKSDSYGIGLSLVKNVTDLYGGAVWVESDPELGTYFYLVFPAQRVSGGDLQ